MLRSDFRLRHRAAEISMHFRDFPQLCRVLDFDENPTVQVKSQVSGLKSRRGDRAILGAAPK
jgi:hypothetical protein